MRDFSCEENHSKERITGIVISGLFGLLLVVLLVFTYIRTQIKTGEEGILVQYGTVDQAAGTFTPKTTGQPALQPQPERVVQQPKPTVKPQPQPVVKPAQNQPVIKGREETVAIDEAKKARQEQLERERIEAERVKAEQAKAEEERRKREAINQQVSGAFGAGNSTASNSGDAQTGSGIQGDPNSASPTGSATGSGYGSFNLSGRSLNGGLPRPSYSALEEGTIVVSITVDTKGNVIFAEIAKGTNIENARMRSDAIAAAQRAKFNSIASGNNQSGTITYKYKLR